MSLGYRDKLLKGRRAMAHLIHLWHERNAWSHRVLPLLSEILDLGRVHNSQISNLSLHISNLKPQTSNLESQMQISNLNFQISILKFNI